MIVYIEWVDAASVESGWKYGDDFEKMVLPLMQTIGHLSCETDDYYAVSLTYAPPRTDEEGVTFEQDDTYAETMFIPKGCVKVFREVVWV